MHRFLSPWQIRQNAASFLYLTKQIECSKFSLLYKIDRMLRVFSTWQNRQNGQSFLYLATGPDCSGFPIPWKSDRMLSEFSLPGKSDSFLYLANQTEFSLPGKSDKIFSTWQMATKCQRPSVNSGSSTLVTRNSFLATVATARQPLGSTNASRPPAPLPVYRLYSCRRCCCCCEGVTVAVVYTGSSRSQQAKVKPRTGPPAAQSAMLGTEMQSVVSWPTGR